MQQTLRPLPKAMCTLTQVCNLQFLPHISNLAGPLVYMRTSHMYGGTLAKCHVPLSMSIAHRESQGNLA